MNYTLLPWSYVGQYQGILTWARTGLKCNDIRDRKWIASIREYETSLWFWSWRSYHIQCYHTLSKGFFTVTGNTRTLTKAMKKADECLIEQGYTLLTDEQWNKMRVLL